jgi:hypothetical protein
VGADEPDRRRDGDANRAAAPPEPQRKVASFGDVGEFFEGPDLVVPVDLDADGAPSPAAVAEPEVKASGSLIGCLELDFVPDVVAMAVSPLSCRVGEESRYFACGQVGELLAIEPSP